MKSTNWQFDAKSVIIGVLFSVVVTLLIFGQRSEAQTTGTFQIQATDDGVYILNVSNGKVRFRAKNECGGFNGCSHSY